MLEETEFHFEESARLKPKKSSWQKIRKFIWNPKNKEFLGRDGNSWGQ